MEEYTLEGFIENLINEIDWGHELEPAIYQQIFRDMLDRAENLIKSHVFNALTFEKQKVFIEMLDDENNLSDEETQSFLINNIENMDEIVLNALLELKAKYIKPGMVEFDF